MAMAIFVLCSTARAQPAGDSAVQHFFDALARADSQAIREFVQNANDPVATNEQGNTSLHCGQGHANHILEGHGVRVDSQRT